MINRLRPTEDENITGYKLTGSQQVRVRIAENPMEYSYIKTAGDKIKVSRLCFGSLCIGPLQSNLGVDEGGEVILRALLGGVNFIDTAQLYKTYEYIDNAQKKAEKFGIKREDTAVSTKTYAYTRIQAKDAFEQARDLLHRRVIDIFMLHEQESIHTMRGHSEALEFFFEQRRLGGIRAVGISTHHADGVSGAVEWNREKRARGDFDSILDIVHPLCNKSGLGILTLSGEPDAALRLAAMSEAVRVAAGEGIFLFAMKALGGGNLYFDAASALDFVLDNPAFGSVALGMKSISEVDENLRYFATRSFSPQYAENANLSAKKLHIDNWCEACGLCVRRCQQGALCVDGGRAVCDHGKCVLCGYCSAVCPVFAIKII